MATNLVMIGSRSRPDNAVRAFNQLRKVSAISDFVLTINEDQADLYPEIDGVTTEVVANGLGANGKANAIIHKYWDKYQTITGIDDDCLVQTQGWDEILQAPIQRIGHGISYGNDGIQGEKLPTKVMISSNIVKALGFFAPPPLFHSFADNFWKRLGRYLNSLHYFDDVNMEHLHWLNGKADKDETYESSQERYERDKIAYQKYILKDFEKDLKRVRDSL